MELKLELFAGGITQLHFFLLSVAVRIQRSLGSWTFKNKEGELTIVWEAR